MMRLNDEEGMVTSAAQKFEDYGAWIEANGHWLILSSIPIGALLAALVIHFGPSKYYDDELSRNGYVIKCIDGVAYIDNGKMFTPKLTVSGLPASCHEK